MLSDIQNNKGKIIINIIRIATNIERKYEFQFRLLNYEVFISS